MGKRGGTEEEESGLRPVSQGSKTRSSHLNRDIIRWPGGHWPRFYSRRNREAKSTGRPEAKTGMDNLGWPLPVGAGAVVVPGVGGGAFAETAGSGGSLTSDSMRTGRGACAGGRARGGMSCKRDPG